ncbi:hypothetical protein [Rheinheimera sp. MMS21-TC3]|uniref:hypothetical protein n=1 Tax=Rheinheimera sp. MMS21-TC3 TaxID=3072790 RepID=UPI0028C3BA92|nr:hypothetical protein [Rheinheimera sp. MMS21-TC3]WNO62232.1 hypothetical protein RDV63_15110 [Rheinheimera sp. MMS21-TC3]
MKKLTLVASVILAFGCQNMTTAAQPAVLNMVNADVKLQLQQGIIALSGGAPVKLSDTVLTNDNILIIEQALLRDSRGLPIMGRHQLPTRTYSLWLDNKRCWLQDESSEKRVELTKVSCMPFAKDP